MGWNTDLLDAQFRGIPFYVQSITDKGSKSLVVHEYPYRSGGAVEDMGSSARTIPIRAIFWGENYLSNLQKLIEALEQPGPGELIHPVFGSVTVVIKTWQIDHTAQHPDYAEVVFEAIVSALDTNFFTHTTQRTQAEQSSLTAKNAATVLLEHSSQHVTRHIQTNVTSPRVQSQTMQLLMDILDFYDPSGDVPRSTTIFVLHPEAYLAELLAVQKAILEHIPVSSVMKGFPYWSDCFPKITPSCGMKTFEYNEKYPTGVGNWSVQWTSNGSPGVHPQVPSLAIPPNSTIEKYVVQDEIASGCDVSMSSQHIIAIGIILHVMLSQTALAILTASQLFLDECTTPTLTPLQLDTIVGNIRARIQDCLVAVRKNVPTQDVHGVSEPLRTAAEAIQSLGTIALNIRPPLITYTVQHEESLHLLAHRLYGDYKRAREILHLNPQIYDPNFLPAGQELLIYAADGNTV
ncbi:hypothetical protein BW722_06900 [Lawsonia intracellularis]|uniref:DNA circularization protein n=1 Tax=Lawsonia intracellularis TaxID=29546 RepID=UPI000975F375|nr:DNA circularization N-terminal domain-containing protein [Lawsonia intracellularis]OMQ01702.1 hypothetical protein BW722_06900 [Lawsonia intracellularis]